MAFSSSNSNHKMIVLMSSDQEYFEVEESVIIQSQTIKHLIEDGCADDSIPLPNVTSKILAKVIEFCRRYDTSSDATDTDFNTEFLKIEQDVLFDLILASNYLDIKALLDVTCQHVANMMKGKTPEQIRELFHIKNDYTPEEEEEVRKENAWAFE